MSETIKWFWWENPICRDIIALLFSNDSGKVHSKVEEKEKLYCGIAKQGGRGRECLTLNMRPRYSCTLQKCTQWVNTLTECSLGDSSSCSEKIKWPYSTKAWGSLSKPVRKWDLEPDLRKVATLFISVLYHCPTKWQLISLSESNEQTVDVAAEMMELSGSNRNCWPEMVSGCCPHFPHINIIKVTRLTWWLS